MRLGLGAAVALTALVLSPAYAVDFAATPINHGAPTNLPGEDIIPGLREALVAVNGLTQPLLQPILAPGGAPVQAAAPSPAAIPKHRRRSAYHAHRQHRPQRQLAHLRQPHKASRHTG